MSEKTPKKEDGRVRYTKLRIRSAFYELLKEKAFEKITVTDICRRAEINRATFYKYYLDAADLAEKLQEEELKKLAERLSGSLSEISAETYVTEILRYIRNAVSEDNTAVSVFTSPAYGSFAYMASKMIYEHFTQSANGRERQEDEILFSYVAAGSAGIMDHWIRSGAKASEEEVAEKIIRLGSAVMKEFR